MVGIENIKSNLINVIQQINDDTFLLNLFKQAVSFEKKDITDVQEEKLDFKEAIVEWHDEHVTFEEILKQQNYKPISYEEFRTKADKIEWEHSLDELLAALD